MKPTYGICGVCDAELNSEFKCTVCPVEIPSAPPIPEVCARCNTVVNSDGGCECDEKEKYVEALEEAVRKVNRELAIFKAKYQERFQK
jgi:predicted amidophosphoribosyltransferase